MTAAATRNRASLLFLIVGLLSAGLIALLFHNALLSVKCVQARKACMYRNLGAMQEMLLMLVDTQRELGELPDKWSDVKGAALSPSLPEPAWISPSAVMRFRVTDVRPGITRLFPIVMAPFSVASEEGVDRLPFLYFPPNDTLADGDILIASPAPVQGYRMVIRKSALDLENAEATDVPDSIRHGFAVKTHTGVAGVEFIQEEEFQQVASGRLAMLCM